MKKIICWFKGHKRGKTVYLGKDMWYIQCSRCEYELEYDSPWARLVSTEIRWGFDGE